MRPPRAGWGALLFTLGFVLLAPLALLAFTRRVSRPGTEGRPRVGRIHLLDATVSAALLLALTWKIGAWQVVPRGGSGGWESCRRGWP